MRAHQRPSGARVPRPLALEVGAVKVFDRAGRMSVEPVFQRSFKRDLGPGERRDDLARTDERCDLGRPVAPRRGDCRAEFRHLPFDRIEPSRVGMGLREQLVPAARRPLEGVHPRAVALVDGQHRPVEEPPPLRCGPREQPVHRGRQPDDAQVFQ